MFIKNSGIICRAVTTCDLCLSKGRLLYSGLSDPTFAAPGEWRLVECLNKSCGVIWVDPRPLADQVQHLYTHYYTHEASGLPEPKKKSLTRITKKVLSKIFFWKAPAFLTDHHHLQNVTPGRLLDVGCGNGAFLAAAAREGWKCSGIDFDAAAVAEANKLDGVTAEVGDLIGRAYPVASFDAIVMSNVIEHVWNPNETVTECFRLLKSGGRLVMITPNTASSGHRIYREHWRGLEPPRHLFIYNRNSLRRLAQNAGFRRIISFSSSGGGTGITMLEASRAIAEKNGRRVDDNSKATIRAETIGSFLGLQRGEWVVAVCCK
jgi:2-polyprenyl-3-methyl-5-hydroxy-6-metoxy-1,4-benzoquinol methylase